MIPSYRRYLRWLGFPVESRAPAGPEGRAAIEANAPTGNIIADPSYQAYVRWNGFRVTSPVDQAGKYSAAPGQANSGADNASDT